MKSTHAAILFSLIFAFSTAHAQMAKEPLAEAADAAANDAAAAAKAAPPSASEVSAAVAGCLEKAAGGQYHGALPACTRAAEIAPQNEQVKAALAKAQAAAGMGGAEAATDGAKAAAGDAVSGAVPSGSTDPADAAKKSLMDNAGGFLK